MKTDRINNLILGSIVLTFCTMVLTYHLDLRNSDAAKWVTHTYEVINQSTGLLSLVKDAETGQRGYLITGDRKYLAPYNVAETNLEGTFNALKELVQDNQSQVLLLEKNIKPWIQLRTELLKKAIVARDQSGQESGFALVRTNAGQHAMDSLRSYMKILTDREYVLLAARQQKLARTKIVVDIARYLSLVFIAFVSTLALIALYKKNRMNQGLMVRLRKFNKALEDLVGIRTSELEGRKKEAEDLNQSLIEHIDELQAIQDTLHQQNQNTEKALHEVNDLYNFSPCGYHSSDPDNVIMRINSTELQWLGYTREEIVGKLRFRDLLSPKSQERLPELIAEFKEKGKISELECELVRKNGEIFPVSVSATAIYDDKGNFAMSRTVVFDLSERLKMETRIKEANEKMAVSTAEKNSFLAMASHDLKSPLNSIVGLINLLKLDNSNLTDDQKENLELVYNASRNMRAMIGKLLDLNRIEQGKSLIVKKEIDIVEVLKNYIAEAQVPATKKKIKILAENFPATIIIKSDVTIIRQILENLVSNAVKFSLPEKQVTLTLIEKNGRIEFEVRDEGPGIRPEETHKVFGKFEKLSARPTGGETSTGLGLSIVKQLVTALDGKVSFRSEVGVGTTFVVELPMT